MPDALLRRPGVAAVAGALTIAFSAILVTLADVEPSTAAIFRCAYALPALGLLAWLEDRRHGRRPRASGWLAIPAGIFFAADLIFWHHAIEDVGAGLATVLGNLQVVVVPFVAWAVLRERVEARLLVALPIVCSGVLLISGVLETGAYGDHPVRGVVFGILTGLSYAGFLLVLRQSGSDLRRLAGPLFDATAVAAVVAVIAGLAVGEADLVPSWPAHAWLITLALTSQVLGWLLIAVLAPAAAGRAHLGHVDDPARRLGAARRAAAGRGAERPPARRRGVHPGGPARDRPPARADARSRCPRRIRVCSRRRSHELETEVMEEVWDEASARSARCSTR